MELDFFNPRPLLRGFNKTFPWVKHVSSCNPYYSPMYYILCVGLQAKQIVEVGVAYGYSSYMLGMAAKENGGMYYGVEKNEKLARLLKSGMDELEIPNTIIWADSKDIKEWTWSSRINFALLDGEHTKEAIEHEVSLFYPKMNHRDYIAIHDSDAWSAEGVWAVINDPKYDLEYITFHYNYGLALIKKREKNWKENWIAKVERKREDNKNRWILPGVGVTTL